MSPGGWVLDASAGIKLCIEEPGSSKVRNWLAGLGRTGAPVVPDLFHIECGNIMWKYVQRVGMPAVDASAAFDRLQQLGLVTIQSQPIVRNALALAIELAFRFTTLFTSRSRRPRARP